MNKKKIIKTIFICVTLVLFFKFFELPTLAQNAGIDININSSNNSGSLGALDIMFVLLFLSMAPSLLLMMTSFTRIIIVFSFLRNALGTQQSPPTQVLVGLSLFLSLFIMTPVINDINQSAYQPYMQKEITQEVAFERAQVPLKTFMLKQIDKDSLDLFIGMSQQEITFNEDGNMQEQLQELNLSIIVPAFVTSELKRAFLIGFLLFIPFLVIDLIVSSTLMSMGMVMLPPSMISLPFKIMVFILADGWGLLMSSLVKGFR